MRLLTILSALALIAYPMAVYYGINRWGITTVGALLAVFFIVRIIAAKQTQLKELKYIGWLSGGVGITLIDPVRDIVSPARTIALLPCYRQYIDARTVQQ